MSERIRFFIKGKKLLAEPYHFKECGLPNVFLLNGVSIDKTSYGDIVHIQHVHGLLTAIGLHIIEKEGPMSGSEFRFLRKQLQLTQKELGHLMATSDQTIANYEKENTQMGPADPHMRLIYLLHTVPKETRAGLLRDIAEARKAKAAARLPEQPRQKMVHGWSEQENQAA